MESSRAIRSSTDFLLQHRVDLRDAAAVAFFRQVS
jgi:hypothetical protein